MFHVSIYVYMGEAAFAGFVARKNARLWSLPVPPSDTNRMRETERIHAHLITMETVSSHGNLHKVNKRQMDMFTNSPTLTFSLPWGGQPGAGRRETGREARL